MGLRIYNDGTPRCGRCGSSLKLHHLGSSSAGCPWFAPPAACGYWHCRRLADAGSELGLCAEHQAAADRLLATHPPRTDPRSHSRRSWTHGS